MPGLRAGLLNRRVTIQQGQPASDAEGNATLTWAPVKDVWAAISPLGTQELILAAQRAEEITHSVTVRYQKEFLPPEDMRILYGSRIFNVVGASDADEAHVAIVMRVKEFVTGSASGAV